MKASLKLKDDSTPPLLRLKVPLNILGFPFQSGVSACGDHKDLSLNLATLFDSGPSVKLVYKPNDSWNPFSLVVKTGVGSYGSTPLSVSAEFNLLSRGNPNFVLRLTPRFGDFGLKKLTRSGSVLKDLEKTEKSKLANGNGGALGSVVSNLVGSGVEVSATSVLPIRKRAVVKFNWGVKVPIDEDRWNIGNLGKIPPFLVMNKISIEHVAGGDLKKNAADVDVAVAEKEIGEVCFGMKRELDMLHAENGILRRSVEEIKSQIVAAGGGKNCRKAPEVEGDEGFNTSSNTSI